MVCSRRTGLFWLISLVICLLVSRLNALDDKVAGMLRDFRDSKEGYITVKNDEFNLLVDGASRPYHVCVFADSLQHRNSPKLELVKRLKYLGTVSKSTLAHQRSTDEGVLDNFIIVRLALEDSRATFGRLGALGLPYFSCIPANMEVVPGKNIELPSRLSMAPAPVEDWNPEQVAKFISAATGLDMGEASQFGGRSPFLPLFALFFLGSVGVVGYKLANSRLIHYMPLYICGSLMVYWFSVSGGMFNIIRQTPFVGIDRRTGKPVVFVGSNSSQVGAEGFIMGSSVVAFGMLLAHFIYLVPTMSDPAQRRKTCYGIMAMGWALFLWISGTHAWKLGFRPSFYF